jgi:1-acyl-sn-glycerol-3-phosphate acyltransferase
MRKVSGFVGVCFWMIIFFLRGWIFRKTNSDPVDQRKALAKNTSFIASKMLKSFGIKVKVNNPQNLKCLETENHLIVANHVSYTDILVLASIYPFVFITSVEMSETPLLGDITRNGGSLFTDRKRYTSLPQEIQNFADALGKGFNIALFPEGTSTNGETIKEFRKSLFQTSIIAQKPILPICVRYRTLDGKPIQTQEQRDIVCWYADMTFVPHFWKLMGHRIEVEAYVLDPIPFDPVVNRQQLCDKVQNLLLSSFHQN